MATSAAAKEVEEELANIQNESSEFSSFFRQTKLMIENKQEQVSSQINVLKESIETLLQQIEGLSAINGIANISPIVLKAIENHTIEIAVDTFRTKNEHAVNSNPIAMSTGRGSRFSTV